MTGVDGGIVRRWRLHVPQFRGVTWSRGLAWSWGALLAAGAVAIGLAVRPPAPTLLEQAVELASPFVLAAAVAGMGALLVLAVLAHGVWQHRSARRAVPEDAAVAPDITARDEALADAASADHDSLTQVFSQATITQRLDQAIAQARLAGGCALLYLDLDRFEQVHDARGHAVGDLLLIEVAQRLQGALRGADAVGRVGENAFAVVLPGVAFAEQARRSAQRLAAVVRAPYTLGGVTSRIDVSVGVALFPADGDSAAALLQQARGALDPAEAGHSASALSEPPAALTETALLDQDLAQALELEQFEMAYQPVFGIRSGAPLSYEALVRWRHPARGLVPASVFMPLCERSGVIEKLGRWMLHTACTEAATWAAPVRLSINIAAAQFRRGDLEHLVIETLHHSGLSPDRLDIEVTEAVLLEYSQQVLASMLPLRTLGVRLVLDDFGQANVGLGRFRDGAFQQLKISPAAIRSMLTDPGAMAVVRSVLDTASDLQIDVVAEGVETQVQQELLTHLGCDKVQGSLAGPPQSPERTRHYLWQATRRIEGGSMLLGAG